MVINPTGEPEAWEPRHQGPNFRFPRLYTPRLMLKQPLDEDREFLTKLFSDPAVMQYIWDGPLDGKRAARYASTIIELTQFSINHGWWVVVAAMMVSGLAWSAWESTRMYRWITLGAMTFKLITSLQSLTGGTDTRRKL